MMVVIPIAANNDVLVGEVEDDCGVEAHIGCCDPVLAEGKPTES